MKILGREEAYHHKFIMACAQQSDGTDMVEDDIMLAGWMVYIFEDDI